MPKCFSSGRKIGTKMTMISVHSSGQPSTKMIACDSIMNCSGVRFIDSTHFSISAWPPRIANTPEKIAEPTNSQHTIDGGLGGQEHGLLGALPVERARLEAPAGRRRRRRPRPTPSPS